MTMHQSELGGGGLVPPCGLALETQREMSLNRPLPNYTSLLTRLHMSRPSQDQGKLEHRSGLHAARVHEIGRLEDSTAFHEPFRRGSRGSSRVQDSEETSWREGGAKGRSRFELGEESERWVC